MQIKYIALLFNYYFIIFLEKRYISPKEKLHSRKKHKLREFSKYPLLLTPPFSISRREGESLPPGFSPSVFTTPPSPGGYPPSPQKTPLSQNTIPVIPKNHLSKNNELLISHESGFCPIRGADIQSTTQ